MSTIIKSFFILLILSFSFQPECYTQTIEEVDGEEQITNLLLEEINISELEKHWSELRHDYGDYLPEIDRVSVKDLITNSHQLSVFDWIQALIKLIGHELIINGQ